MITFILLQTENSYDKLYITWDICNYGFFGYNFLVTGSVSPVSLILYQNYLLDVDIIQRNYDAPVGMNAVNLRFVSDGSVNYKGFKIAWESF